MSDEPRCAKCGHRATYHGMTFCRLEAGSDAKKCCDCDGWRRDTNETQRVLTRLDTQGETK